MSRLLFLALYTLLAVGCRPPPHAVVTIVSFDARGRAGKRCHNQCQSTWHACAAECRGPSTSVVIGVGPIAVGHHSSPATCRSECWAYRNDCLRGCPGVQERSTRVRVCPHGPGYCEEPDPASPVLDLPLYCRGPDGHLRPCE